MTITPIDSDEGRKAIETYGWAGPGHGLVTFKTSGEALGNLPGHNFGKTEIKAEIERLLAG